MQQEVMVLLLLMLLLMLLGSGEAAGVNRDVDATSTDESGRWRR